MAVTEKNITSTGATSYTFEFEYLKTTDVKVSVNGTATTEFQVPSGAPTTVQFNTGHVPASGAAIRIYRDTNVDNLEATFYAGSAIKSQDLNDNFNQNLYVTQEAKRDAGAAWQDGDDTINSTETWHTSDDSKIATTKAIENRIGTKIDTALTTDVSGGDGVTITDNSPGTGQIRVDLDTDIATLRNMQSGAATQLAALTSTELAILDQATVTTTELNKLDGLTPSTTELNYVKDVTSSIQTQLDGKQDEDAELTELATMGSTTAAALADLTEAEVKILDGATVTKDELNILDGVTATKDEINILDGVTATKDEINILDGVTVTKDELNILDDVTADKNEINKLDGLLATTSELNTLDGILSNTSELNKLDGVTASTSELNIVAGKSFKTSSGTLDTTSDTEIPSSKVIAAHVASSQTAIGGFTTIADEVSFPNTQPANGVVVSINNAAGLVVNGSGVSTSGKRVDNTTVTINGFPSSLNGETLAAGVGLIVVSTSTANTYSYHKILTSETDVKQLSDDINDFNARYRVAGSAPGSNNDEGDLYFDTAANKMKVYNGSAWDDVASVGSFFVNTLSSSSGTGGGSATFNGSAYRFTLSNAGQSAQQHIVSVNGVVQKPNSGTSQPSEGFAIDGNDIIFSAAPASGSDSFIVTCGSSVSIGTPSANSVNSSHIIDGSIVNGDISSSANIAFSKLNTNAGATFGGDVTLTGDTANVVWDKSTDDLTFGTGANLLLTDNSVIRFTNGLASQTSPPNEGVMFGASGSEWLKIYNDTTRSNIIGGVSGGVFISGTKVTLDGDVYTDDDIYIAGSDATKITWDKSADSLSFANDTKAIWGGTSELQIEHDGTTNKSVIQTTTTDPLLIKCAGDLNFVYTSGGSEATGATWDPGGAWSFSHGSSTKLATTSTGINVTGAINVNGTALSTAPEITATASGAVTAGKTMMINSNGTTSPVSATKVIRSTPLFTTTTDSSVASGNGQSWSIAYDKDNNVILFTYENSSNSIQCLAGTPGTNTITWGSEITVNSDGGSSGSDVCYVGSGKFIIVYRDGDNKGRARMISVSSNTCTAGAEQTIGSTTSSIGKYLQCTYHEQQARIYIFTDVSTKLRFTSTTIGSNVDGWATDWRSKTSGGSGSDGSGTYFRSDNDYTRFDLNDNNYEIGNSYSVYDPDSQRVHVMYCNDSQNRMEVVSCDAMSSTGVNTPQTIFSNNPDSYTIASIGYDTVTNRGVGCYEHSNDLRARTFTWNSSNTNFDFGTELTVTASLHGMLQVMGTDSGAVGFVYSSSDDLKCRIGTLNTSNGDISLGTEGTLPGSGADNNGHPVAVTYNPNQDLIYTITKYSDAGVKWVESVAITETNTNAEGYVGIANNTASNGNSVTIRTFGATNDNQSGLTVGSLYYIQKDGTLSTTADTPSVQAGVALSATKLLIKG